MKSLFCALCGVLFFSVFLCDPVWADSPSSVVEYTADDARDPFQSLLPSARRPQAAVTGAPIAHGTRPVPTTGASLPIVSASSGTLEGIVWGGPRPQAVIDGEVYDLGDVVQGARITSIEPGGVIGELSGHAIRWTLPSPLKENE